MNVMSLAYYNTIRSQGYEHRGFNFVRTIMDMHVFVGNMSYVMDFTILENVKANIDPSLLQVVFGRPFMETTKVILSDDDVRRGCERACNLESGFYKGIEKLGPLYRRDTKRIDLEIPFGVGSGTTNGGVTLRMLSNSSIWVGLPLVYPVIYQMSPKRKSTFEASAMTHDAIKKLVADNVATALEAQANNPNSDIDIPRQYLYSRLLSLIVSLVIFKGPISRLSSLRILLIRTLQKCGIGATKGTLHKFEQRSKPFIPPNQVVMSANDDFSLHDDEELSLHDDGIFEWICTSIQKEESHC
ncbi:hypothetical protein Tco_1468052 [Tanacetum coccineum]